MNVNSLESTIGVGSLVSLPRDGASRWVVAEIIGGPRATGDYAKLIRKRSDGTYAQHVRPLDGLVEEPFTPFKPGETVRINSIPEKGEFLLAQDGVALVAMPTWTHRTEQGTKLNIDPSTAHVSVWSLVLENRT